MTVTVHIILMVIALVLFLLAALNAPTKVQCGWLGLAIIAIDAILFGAPTFR